MGLCPSKPHEVHDALEKAPDHGVQGTVSAKPEAQVHAGSSSSSPAPDHRLGSPDSGQPAAAAGDGAAQPLVASKPAAAAGFLLGNSNTSVSPVQQHPVQQQPQHPLSVPTSSAAGSQGQPYVEPACSSPPATAGSPPAVTSGNGALLNGIIPPAAPTQQDNTPATSPAQQQQPQLQQPHDLTQASEQQPVKQWDRTSSVPAPSALATAGSSRLPSSTGRSVKFAATVPKSEDGSMRGDDSNQRLSGSEGGSEGASARKTPSKRSMPRRSISTSSLRSGPSGNEVSEAVLAKQAEILRSNKAGKLRMRRGGLDSSFAALQGALTQDAEPVEHVATRAAGLKHIGFGPFKRENQDEFFIQVGDFGGVTGGNLFCVFDGHGTHGKDAALYSRQLLPRLLDVELRKYFMRVGQDSESALRGAVEVLITEVFGDTERNLAKSGVNLASSGTTASVAFQRGNRLWVASAGDSRAILCTRNSRDQWRALPLTIDHRPRRTSERERIEAAGARVAPKRLPSGRSVGEPRLWLQQAGGPGLLLSRSLGDLTAATVGCTSDPEVTFTTLRPHIDQVLVMATDGVWDVLTNEQVCDIVVESPDPHIACRRVLDAALYEWEERMSADNITVLVVEFEWNCDDAVSPTMEAATATAFRPEVPTVLQAVQLSPTHPHGAAGLQLPAEALPGPHQHL